MSPSVQPPQYREIGVADIPRLFFIRTRTRENTFTLEQLYARDITPASAEQKLATSFKGWLGSVDDQVVGFSMADSASGELWVIAVLPDYEGRGIGASLMGLAEQWLWQSGCSRAWLTTDLDPSRRAYGFYRHRGWTDWKIEDGLRWLELLRTAAQVDRPSSS